MVTVEYLESERKKIWQSITDIKDSVDKKTTDYEADAKQASRKASEFRNKCETTKNEINTLLEEIKELRNSCEESEREIKKLAQDSTAAKVLAEEIKTIHNNLISRNKVLDENIAALEELFENYSSFADKIQALEDIHKRSDDFSAKIEASYNQLQARKKEIDQLYYEIVGYKSIDPDTNEESEVKGLKHDLEYSFTEIKAGFSKFSEDKKKEFSDKLATWSGEYQTALQKIQSLLPHALTTGLSYAYSEKKEAEIKEGLALDKVFKRYVKGLVAVSLIPFGVSVYQLFAGTSLEGVILQMPRLVLSILPLYIPILWVAYSANRKTNLSKRLVEEYTHKEVISKTFEGLAQQIHDLDDKEISADLKTRLLYNILEVSSENPGKLISNYDKSDHPLMDALDKSAQLTNAVDKISNIPGMSRLAGFLDKRSKNMLEHEGEKAIAGLATIEQK